VIGGLIAFIVALLSPPSTEYAKVVTVGEKATWPDAPYEAHWCGIPNELADDWARVPAQVRVEIMAWGPCIRFETTGTLGSGWWRPRRCSACAHR
jgi:hypothetical protein